MGRENGATGSPARFSGFSWFDGSFHRFVRYRVGDYETASTISAQPRIPVWRFVAPGIAEALFATALGLVAAIPAVLAYNKLSSDIDRYSKRLEAFSGEFGAILSRQLEEKV